MRAFSFRVKGIVLCGLLSAVGWIITGCENDTFGGKFNFPETHSIAAGRVMGGRQPIGNSSILLSEVGAFGRGTSNGLANAQSDAEGNFNIDSFTCQAGNSQVFITASGGDAGNGYNSNIFLLAMLGPCNNLPNNVNINELSTVAAAYAFHQGMLASGPQQIGANGAPNTTAYIGMTNAGALLVKNLVNVSTGSASSFLSTGVNSPMTINTLADLLVTCVDSVSPFAPCQDLYTAVTPPDGTVPQNTLQAIFQIASNAGNNVAGIYNILSEFPASLDMPFQPILPSAPTDWLLALNYNPGDLQSPRNLSIDHDGNVWITNATGGTNMGSITELSPTGTELSPHGGYLGGTSLNGPSGLFIDTIGRLWVTNLGTNDVVAFDGTGSLAVPPNEIEIFGPSSIATDSFNQIWITNSGTTNNVTELTIANTSEAFQFFASSSFGLNDPTKIVADTTVMPNIMWAANTGSGGVTRIVNDGTTNVSGASIAGGGQQDQQDIALDSQGNAWVTNSNSSAGSVTKISGNSVALGSLTIGGITSTSAPSGIITDSSDHVWVINFNTSTLTELDANGNALSPDGGFTAGGLIKNPQNGIGVDRSGNVWLVNVGNNTVTELLGAAAPTHTPRSSGRPTLPAPND